MTTLQKTAVVTASYSGIGFELSRQLIEKGFSLAVINRDQIKARTTIEQLKKDFPDAQIRSYIADLSNHDAIRQVAAEIARDFPVIDALFNNAGVLLPSLQFSPQGNEMHFEINTVAPFLLIHLLKPQLARSNNAVVVTSGSGARRMASMLDVVNLKKPKAFKKMSGPYAQSKLAITTACAALTEEFKSVGISLKVVDLNPTKTEMASSDGMPGWIKLFRFLFLSPKKSAQQLMDAAFAQKPYTPQNLPDKNTQKQLLDLLYTTTSTISK
jgi:NAD(P)-dependent dehydrogenase (short-subunit alcohol dehydrogenase family)